MGQEAAVAVAVPPPIAVFSWEHEPAAMARKQAAAPENLKKPPVARALSVPPPPGRPAAAPRMSFSRAVRPEEDPFLAAYLACTNSKNGGGQRRTKTALEPKGSRRSAWARLELGLGLGLGLGLSCKRSSSNGVVEESMVRLAKLSELDPRDDA